MSATDIIAAGLSLLAGIGVFLVACKLMSTNIESASGPGLRKLFFRTYNNRLLGVGIGTAVTALVQSSGAVTVMVIGFVNASVMNLTQAATIIFGANIGTTVTGQIVALGMFSGNSISTSVLFSALAGIGAFMMSFCKKDSLKKIGGIVTGFGMLFIGLSMMSSSMKQFAELESVRSFLAGIQSTFVLIITGALLTAIVQSSSVMTSVAITMLVSGLITLSQGIYITIGSNIGACIVGVLAGITGNTNAKRTSLIGVIFNVSGAVFFVIVELLLKSVSGISCADIMFRFFPKAPQTQLAMFHTFYNVLKVAVALPFTNLIVKAVEKLVPQKDAEKKGLHPYFLDYSIMATPAIAARSVKNELLNMGKLAMENFNLSLDIICTQDMSRIDEFNEREKELDYLNHEIVHYSVELLKYNHTDYDRKYISTTFRSAADFERIGDYSENITEYEQSLSGSQDSFSSEAIAEIEEVRSNINNMAELIFKAYRDKDDEAFNEANEIEDRVDHLTNMMAENHVARLNRGICTANTGAQYLSLAENAERVADHLINVGKTIFELR